MTVEAIRAAIDGGITLIDTAPRYGFGHSEELVGQAIRGYDREKLVISTKCGLWWKDNEGTLQNSRDGHTVYRNLSKRTIKIEIEDSLRRIGTDYIDTYITHWQSKPPFVTPISETMEALLELKQEGKIKAIGVSNVTPDHIKEYLKYGQVDLVQEKYSLLSRQVEEEILPLCRENHITLQAYSPMELGLLTGKSEWIMWRTPWKTAVEINGMS